MNIKSVVSKVRKLSFLTAVGFLLLLASSAVVLTGCGGLTPAAVQEGHDPVVVNAERAQRSSLDIFRQVTVWEYNNRELLPFEVSRAVDRFRKEFPPAWDESRVALKAYKERAGPTASDIDRITAALLTAQESLLRLKKDASPNEITQLNNSLTLLIQSIRTLTKSSPANTVTPPVLPIPPSP